MLPKSCHPRVGGVEDAAERNDAVPRMDEGGQPKPLSSRHTHASSRAGKLQWLNNH